MELGVAMPPTDVGMRPDRLAQEAEDRGFGSVWFPEHTHIPTSRRTPWPGGADRSEAFKRTFDPFVALTWAAAATQRIKLATGICLVAQRDPIVTAKVVASLDVLSSGRAVLGVGAGWNTDEMENHGLNPSTRRGVLREHVLAMKALWTEDEASYHGVHVRLTPSWSWPKPAQHPHPPVVMGGAGGPMTFEQVAEFCDGWMPIHGQTDLADQLPELAKACVEVGRDPVTVEVGVFGVPPKEEAIDAYRVLGVSRCVITLPPATADVLMPLLDDAAPLAERFAAA